MSRLEASFEAVKGRSDRIAESAYLAQYGLSPLACMYQTCNLGQCGRQPERQLVTVIDTGGL